MHQAYLAGNRTKSDPLHEIFYKISLIISQLFGFMYYGKMTIFLDIVPPNRQTDNISGYCAEKSAYIFECCADFSAYIFEYMPISLLKILNKDRLENIFFIEYQTKYGVFFKHKYIKLYLRATI